MEVLESIFKRIFYSEARKELKTSVSQPCMKAAEWLIKFVLFYSCAMLLEVMKRMSSSVERKGEKSFILSDWDNNNKVYLMYKINLIANNK